MYSTHSMYITGHSSAVLSGICALLFYVVIPPLGTGDMQVSSTSKAVLTVNLSGLIHNRN